MSVITLTDANFAEHVERTKGIVLVDFWAPWCLPCLLVGPAIERVADAFEGQVTVAKLNVDEQPRTAARFHIQSIPTVAVFRDGKLINTAIGARSERAYAQILEAALRGSASAPATKTTDSPTATAMRRNVTVFSMPTCPWCTRLKAYLRDRGIAFKDVDVSRDGQAATEMVRRSGELGVPQVWIDGQTVVGFDRKRINELLGLQASA